MPRVNFTSSFLDALALALPALTANSEWGVPTAVGASAAVAASSYFVRSMQQRTEQAYAMNADGSTRIVLNSIPISHFAERVRWCLDYMAVPYEEEVDIGIILMLLTGRSIPALTIPSIRTSIGNSSDILRYLFGKIELKPSNVRSEDWIKFFNPNTSALMPEWKSFNSNSDEMEWIEVSASELDVRLGKLGSAVQGYAYGGSHVDHNSDALKRAWGAHLHEWIPWYQRVSMQLGYPVVLFLLRNLVFSNSPENVANCRRFIVRMVDFVSRVLDGQPLREGYKGRIIPPRQFILATERPTFVDFSFASLIGVMFVDQSKYANGKFRGVPFDYQNMRNAEDYVALVDYIESTSAGRLINHLYTYYRSQTCAHTSSKL